jgi:hypothetical protein
LDREVRLDANVAFFRAHASTLSLNSPVAPNRSASSGVSKMPGDCGHGVTDLFATVAADLGLLLRAMRSSA